MLGDVIACAIKTIATNYPANRVKHVMIEMTALQLHQHLSDCINRPFLLDVREPWEYQHCHITGSVLIPMADIFQNINELDSQQETVVICHHGIRSRQIAHFLESQNFINVINLTGGVEAWAESVDPAMARY